MEVAFCMGKSDRLSYTRLNGILRPLSKRTLRETARPGVLEVAIVSLKRTGLLEDYTQTTNGRTNKHKTRTKHAQNTHKTHKHARNTHKTHKHTHTSTCLHVLRL